MVYVVNDGLQVVACGSRDNNLLSACVDVSHGLLLGAVEAGALQNNVNTKLAPRAIVGVLLSVDLQRLAVNDDGIVGGLYSVLVLTQVAHEGTLSGVVLEQMSQHAGAGQIVDCNNLITLCLEHLTESKTADTAKTINSYFNHCKQPPK